jgi:DNA-binding Lrp family transcriptional regulator
MMGFTKNIDEKNDQDSKIFVLINCIDGKIKPTIEELEKINAVIEVRQTSGPYDIIITVELKSNDEIKKTLTQQLRKIETIRCTLTLRSSDDVGVLD